MIEDDTAYWHILAAFPDADGLERGDGEMFGFEHEKAAMLQ
jgi:hypothetical protein